MMYLIIFFTQVGFSSYSNCVKQNNPVHIDALNQASNTLTWELNIFNMDIEIENNNNSES